LRLLPWSGRDEEDGAGKEQDHTLHPGPPPHNRTAYGGAHLPPNQGGNIIQGGVSNFIAGSQLAVEVDPNQDVPCAILSLQPFEFDQNGSNNHLIQNEDLVQATVLSLFVDQETAP